MLSRLRIQKKERVKPLNNTYSCSYVEVLEILKHIPKEDYIKIPEEKIEFYKNNMDKNYIYIYNPIMPKTLRKTDAILINLYKNYIAKEDEKQKINQILKLNEMKEEQEKQKKFRPNNIFNNHVENENINENTILVVEHKETMLKKIINKIKRIFHIS